MPGKRDAGGRNTRNSSKKFYSDQSEVSGALKGALRSEIATAVGNTAGIPDKLRISIIQAVTEAVLKAMDSYYADIQKKMDEKIESCNDKIEQLEQYSRRNALRVFGAPEEGANEKTDDIVTKIISGKLGVEMSPEFICRSHRIGKLRTSPQARPRPIIVKFTSYNKRQEVFRAKKQLKGTGIVIQEDLTIRRQRVLQKLIDTYGFGNTWTADGRLFFLDPVTKKKNLVSNFKEYEYQDSDASEKAGDD